jgi:exosortase/archaeosortase family protein
MQSRLDLVRQTMANADNQLLSGWALALVAGLVVAALIVGFATAGYFIATRRAQRPFVGFIIRYAVVFLSLLVIEAGFLWLAPSVHRGMQHLTAVVVGWAVGLAGAGNSVSGWTLTLRDPAIAFEIDVACLGGILFWSYVALVVAEPAATRRQRLLGLGAGLLVLVAFNLFRITTSIYVEWSTGVNIHDYFYFFNMVFVLCVWAIWLRIIRPKRQAAAPKAG